MADYGDAYTEKELKKLEKEIEEVYKQAHDDMEKKMKNFNINFVNNKFPAWQAKLNNGEITQKEFDSWLAGQMFQSQQWQAKEEQLCNVLYNANSEAINILNGGKISVFAENANWTSYSMEHDMGINFGFGIYDKTAVTQLIKNNPDVLPKWKVNEKKDYIWNKKKANSVITQGIVQGKKPDEIAKDLTEKLSAQNYNLMKTHARTAMTAAQNMGRYQSLMDAKELGIDVYKEWMATLDGRTRDSHRHMDGEKQKVGDKWHPFKFSNGCRYPGDPQGPPWEVYNCRCTMVGDIEDYPAEYERRDNIDGVPIKNMSYMDWLKAKGGTLKPPKIDYSKYGGKDVYDVLKKYKDYDDFVYKSSADEFGTVMDVYDGKDEELKKAINDINNPPKAQVKQNVQGATELETAKHNLADLQKQIQDVGADKTFSGIWKDDVTYADWDAKKDSIQAKKDYYNEQITNLANQLANDPNAPQWVSDKLDKFLDLNESLEEFEKHGEEYSKMLKDASDLKKQIKDLTPKPEPGHMFNPDAYTQERKDNALWAQSPQQADKNLRSVSGDVWKNASKTEKEAIYEYTQSYHKFNEPLRGIEYGTNEYKGVGNTDLDAGYTHNGRLLNAMTDIIDKSSYEEDMWFQRGCQYSGMDKFFQCDMDLLRYGTQEQLEDELLGKTVTEFGFMSMGSSKGRGFSGNVMLNIYAPAGTKMMYVEPFSAFGGGSGMSWDGISAQSYFGGELETIMQQGTEFIVTKVERVDNKVYFDIEVIDQSKVQRWEG